jgi:RNA polymerase sigma factor (sigma-70 family)
MTTEQPGSDAWLSGLLAGDEQIVAEFWQEYGGRLQRLAERHLSPQLQRRVASDDVIQSVCRTFFRRAREGQFSLPDAEQLWRLLCVITLTKCRLLARYHGRERRATGREQQPHDSQVSCEPAAHDPAPEEAAELADELARLMASLDAEEQQVVELKLQELTNDEVAKRLGCSERTVRRVLKRAQTRLERAFEQLSTT